MRWKGFRFFFFSADGSEPPHVHVEKDDRQVKVWLSDMSVAINVGFNARELSQIVRKTRDEREAFLEAWHGHFKHQR